jgi:hypothetical protein
MSPLRRIGRALGAPLRHGIQINHDIARTVFLAGCGRSGTTWLSEVLNADRHYHYLFEPFNNKKTRAWRNFAYRQYLARDAVDSEALAAAASILSGRTHSLWIDSQNRAFISGDRLVKDTRANLMLGWLRACFPQMPVVLLTRHPLAVTRSRQKLGWGPGVSLEALRAQPELMRRHLDDYRGLLEDLDGDDFAMQIANWCIEHLVPLREMGDGEYCLVVYESLVRDPDTELERLFAYLGRDFTDAHRSRLSRASATASRGTRSSLDARKLLRPWEGKLTEAQEQQAQDIVAAFGLGDLLRKIDGADQAVSATR